MVSLQKQQQQQQRESGYQFKMKMASDESMSIRSCISIQEDEDVDEITDEAVDDHDHHLILNESHLHNFSSRLSMRTSSSFFCGAEDDDDDEAADNDMRMYMSRLSIEGFDGDVDDQFSDDHDKQQGTLTASSDSDKEVGCYSLPATPPRRRVLGGAVNQKHGIRMGSVKGYASENEVGDHHIHNHVGQKMMYYSSRNKRRRKRERSRRMRMSMSMSSRRNKLKDVIMDEEDQQMEIMSKYSNSINSGESESGGMTGGGGGGLVVITRPKGGRRSLCMGMEEVKACRDLGFELEHQRMLEMSTTPTTAFSFDTASSGGNSPIANWRISSPGITH